MPKQWKNFAVMALTLLGAYGVTRLPFPDSFSEEAVHMVGIALVGAVFWITECIPIALTGLVIILLQALFGIQDISTGLRHIATPVNSIIFAGFIMATALAKYHLDRRISLGIVAAMGERTERLLLGIMMSTAFLSMWISNSAATAIMLPIALGIIKMAKVQMGRSNLGKILMIGIALAANIGGMGTPAGTPASSITIAFIYQLTGTQLGFLDWVVKAVPVVVLLVPLAWRILLWVYPVELPTIEGGNEAVRKELREMGILSGVQKKVLLLFAVAVFLWIADSFVPNLPDGWLYIASVLISLLFVAPVLGVVSWKEAASEMGWDIFILVGGGLALGSGLNETGVISIIANSFSTVLVGLNAYVVIMFLAFVTAFSITFFSSLTATSTTFVPVAIGLGYQLGLDPIRLGVVAGLASCLAFLLPANTPPNAIVYNAGYFKTHEMAKVGLVITLASVVVLSLVANLLWF